MNQEITQNFQAQNGDVIEFDYKIVSIWEQSQINSIIDQISQDPRMIVLNYEVIPSTWYSDILKVQVKIRENPFPILILVLAISSIAVSVFIYLSLDKIYLISREVPEAITGGVGAVSLGILAVIAIVVFMIFSKAHG